MIVVDASLAVAALLSNGPARSRLRGEEIHVPHLIDVEIAHAFRTLLFRDLATPPVVEHALLVWRGLAIGRHGAHGLLPRIWALRDNLTAYDATYVALAEALDCTLVTADVRLAQAHGPQCEFEVVRPA